MQYDIEDIKKALNEYIKEIKSTDINEQSEHTSRPCLQNMLKGLITLCKKNIKITHEPKRDSEGRGSPDFKFEINDTTIGYIENKKINTDLDKIIQDSQKDTPTSAEGKQIKKYQALTENLILTDYLRWIWIYQGNIIKDIRLCESSLLNQKTGKLKPENCKEIYSLITNFVSKTPEKISNPKQLAKLLAEPASYIKLEIIDNLKKHENTFLHSVYRNFKEVLISNLSIEDFADSFTQTLVYSLFLARLNSNQEDELNIYNLDKYINNGYDLIRDLLKFLPELNKSEYNDIKPFIDRLLGIINAIDVLSIAKAMDLSGKEDPYIYFYEDFLEKYDPKIKADRGVFYTPSEVVRFMVGFVDDVLKSDFKLDGWQDNNVKSLDFACGTGTFMLEIYKHILGSVSRDSLKSKGLIENHVLRNIYGFELMMSAYCIAQLKLSQYLASYGYDLKEKNHRIPVYLTNTLQNRATEQLGFSFIPELANEGKKAQEIKDDKDILVIIGNPPYSGESHNKVEKNKDKGIKSAFKDIKDLISDYFPKDDMKERNPKWLNDDYVKFVRFAEHKIEKAGDGIMAVITNHGFLDNPTFRQMRNHLKETFDKIYIVDLHGNTRKKEKSPDGSKDENVFDIMQGVSIAICVKNSNPDDPYFKYEVPQYIKQQMIKDGNFTEKEVTDSNGNKRTIYIPDKTEEEIKYEECRKIGKNENKNCMIYHAELYGKRQAKFNALSNYNTADITKDTALLNLRNKNNDTQNEVINDSNENDYTNINFTKINPVAPFYSFIPQDEKLFKHYDKGFSLRDIFKVNSVGIKTTKDSFTINFNLNELKDCLNDFINLSNKELGLKYEIIKDTQDWSISTAKNDINKQSQDINKFIKKINYRPFDCRYTFYTGRSKGFVGCPSYKIMKNMINQDSNKGLIFTRQTKVLGEDSADNLCFISDNINDVNLYRRGSASIAPLYLYNDNGDNSYKEVNFTKKFAKMIATKFNSILLSKNMLSKIPKDLYEEGKVFSDDGKGVTPEEILGYIYAVLHSPSYRKKYLPCLKQDFPKVPFDVSIDKFKQLAKLGQELINAHLMKSTPNITVGEPRYDSNTDNQRQNDDVNIHEQNYIMEKVIYKETEQKLYFNKTSYFDKVSSEVWQFKIGGYQVLDKYLKSRKRMDISNNLEHIQKIIKVLSFTIGKMKEIDKIWPN